MLLPYALNAYGLPHTMGFLPATDGRKPEIPLTTVGLMDAAARLGLAGVDTPLPADLPVAAIRDALAERQLRLVAEAGAVLNVGHETLEKASACGAKVLRVVLSGILCGDRRGFPGGWANHRVALAQRLRELLPLAEGLDLSLALENHQDATIEDFLWLYEHSGQSPAFGVCLDTGNPLAVGEEPVETARALAPLLRHLHLKDYTIHFAPNGYRLVRCANGDGVIDFPTILAIALGNGFAHWLPGIEIAAQATRTIPLLEDSWWTEYPPRDATMLLGALRLLWKHGRPIDEPYSSAWERGADTATILAEEWTVIERSVAYFHEQERRQHA